MKTLVVSLLLFATACAPLSQHDSVLGDIGEVAGRTLLCPVTLCFSEIGFYNNWKNEQEQERYSRWYNSLSPEQQGLEDQRQHERRLAAMQALGMMNMGRPLLQYMPPPRIIAPNTAMPMYQPPTRRCTSFVNGQIINTTCN